MGMPLASDDTKIRNTVQFVALSQHVPVKIRRVNAVNVGMTVQNRRKPRRCGTSPGNNGK